MNKALHALTPRGPRGRSWPGRLNAMAAAVIGVPLVSAFVYSGLCNVEGGHRVVIFNKLTGMRDRVFEEGTIWRWPLLEEAIDYDIRVRPRSIGSLTGSKDLQMVKTTLRVLYRPDPDRLTTIYRTLSTDFDERVLPSIVNEVSKSVVANYNASQLIVQREDVSRKIKERLTQRARDFHILLGDVSITHLSFGREYSNAVEAKQVAQQEAERAKFVVERAEQEKKSAIIRATGEARSALLIGQAIQTNPNFIRLRKIDTAREVAQILAASQAKVVLPAHMLILDQLGGGGEIADGVAA